MNLFDMTDPAKVQAAKEAEARQAAINDVKQWKRCSICERPIHPLYEIYIKDRVICQHCYMKNRKEIQYASQDQQL